MPTIYDIAKLAGVSATTVSKVFNDYDEVSQKTKDKVMKIAVEIGYVPNLSARSIRTNRSYLIGVVFSEDMGIGLEHPFFSVVLESFRKAIGEYGFDTIFINNSVGEKKIGYLDHCKYRKVDGLFIITAHPDDLDFENLFGSKIKCVTTDIIFKDIPYVMSDNIEGVRTAIDYLYKNGHHKIAHLGGPLHTLSSRERYEAYKTVMNEKQLVVEDRQIVLSEAFGFDEAYEATLELLGQYKSDELPTAIFASADIMAIGAIKAIESLGLKVPEDISVIGFDDIAFAQLSSPALTTIRQDKVEIGRQVAYTLNQLISNKDTTWKPHRIPVTLIERDTVKKINAAE